MIFINTAKKEISQLQLQLIKGIQKYTKLSVKNLTKIICKIQHW